MSDLLKKNVTNEAFQQFWDNLNTKILPKKLDAADAYVHPTSGVSAGTYRSVTVDANGHITAGTNPTTLADYGVTAVPVELLSGTISIDNIPHAALERCVVVADDDARFALTADNVQVGDTVKVTASGKMYFVVDAESLDDEDGYEVYTAGTAAAVEWSGVLNKPETYAPSAHTHTVSEITDFPESIKNPNAIKITGAGITYDGTTLSGNDTVTTYDGSSEVSFNLVDAIINVTKAINNGALATGLVMTAADVDTMMGITAEGE